MTTYLINNKTYTQENAKIPITPELLRGYGVFETLRTYDKKTYQLKEHIKRLFDGAKKINLEIAYSKNEIEKMVEKLSSKSEYENQRIKITALKGTLIVSSEEQKIDAKVYTHGVNMKSIIAKREIPEIKSISYLLPFLSHEKAAKEKAFDALMIDEKGEVYEGAYSNIFWLKNDELYTRKDHVLPGITAKSIIKISQLKVQFGKISLKELKKCDEVFITSSIYGLVPIKRIDKTKIGKTTPGPKTKLLIDAYDGAREKTLRLQK